MERQNLRGQLDIIQGEYLKTGAELGLQFLGRIANTATGLHLANLVRGGEYPEDERLSVEVAGLQFDNPVMVGAGWDKKGRAVDGLLALGFSGVEVGSVLVHPQKGNPRPRLWTDSPTHSVGLNRLGFNSSGMEAVGNYLETQLCNGVIGISLGKNKLTPDAQAPWAHAAVAEYLKNYADYFVINVASPNTPGLRNLLNPRPLTDIIRAVQDVAGDTPLFVKTTIDLAKQDLDAVLQVCLDEHVAGIVDTNTTIDNELKVPYGWNGEAGGLSGNDATYRQRATEQMRYITCATRGSGLARIGVGGIHDATTAIERLEAGAQVVQIVTGIREKKGKIARDINNGIIAELDARKLSFVQELTGLAA